MYIQLLIIESNIKIQTDKIKSDGFLYNFNETNYLYNFDIGN